MEQMRPELNKMLDKAMEDPGYLERALANPQGAAHEVGVELTPEEVEQIRPLNLSQARDLQEAIASGRSGC